MDNMQILRQALFAVTIVLGTSFPFLLLCYYLIDSVIKTNVERSAVKVNGKSK